MTFPRRPFLAGMQVRPLSRTFSHALMFDPSRKPFSDEYSGFSCRPFLHTLMFDPYRNPSSHARVTYDHVVGGHVTADHLVGNPSRTRTCLFALVSPSHARSWLALIAAPSRTRFVCHQRWPHWPFSQALGLTHPPNRPPLCSRHTFLAPASHTCPLLQALLARLI